MNIKSKKVDYIPAQKELWIGREANPNFGKQYWHEVVQCIDLEKNEDVQANVGLIGYACEEGVRRNLGRIGAVNGPNSVRERLGKVAYHTQKTIADVGTIYCVDHYLEECQQALSEIVAKLIQQQTLPIAIGGGHDIAYANFKGVYSAVKHLKKQQIGIVNFDAHFDLRPIETQANSGTPFNQIINELKQENKTVNYLPIGIQHQANTKELFEIAKQNKVHYIDSFHCEFNQIKSQLDAFINQNDYIYITIDMDGFSSAYAPGVSAPSPLGFTPNFVIKTLQHLLKSKKVISCDIAELNPVYDVDSQTANLASRLVDFIVNGLS